MWLDFYAYLLVPAACLVIITDLFQYMVQKLVKSRWPRFYSFMHWGRAEIKPTPAYFLVGFIYILAYPITFPLSAVTVVIKEFL